jgi:hypothetical protein
MPKRGTFTLGIGVLLAAACAIRGPSGEASSSTAASTTHAGAGGGAATGPTSTGTSGAGLLPNLPESFSVSGRVVDQDGMPVEGATVLQGGRSTEPTTASAGDGTFTLTMSYPGFGTPTVVASKVGFRTAGVELFELPVEPLELVVRAAKPPDNEGYVYGEPGKGKDPSTLFCGHCHDTIASEFQTSKHAQAARDPLVQDLYAGVSEAHPTKAACEAAGGSWRLGRVPGSAAEAMAKCYLGGGVLPDLNATCANGSLSCDDPALPAAAAPMNFGGCADCHAPGMDGKAGGRNLLDATGVGYENGVHCDFCHKVADVELALAPGTGGRLRVQRPHETTSNGPPGGKLRPVMFGPLLDVPNPLMGASLQPKFSQAVFCAGCHEDRQAALLPGTSLAPRFAEGLPVHTTYSEWLAGPYAPAGVPCQHCHMPANDELDSSADLGNPYTASITFGFPRPPEQIRRHIFRSPLVALSPQGLRLIDTALTSSVAPALKNGNLEVEVAVGNLGCGHAVPTGEPMRAVVMIVEALCDGVALAANGGVTLDEVGGAKLRGSVGAGISVVNTTLAWTAATSVATKGDVVRVVRPTNTYIDYDGIELFAGNQLPAAEKGMPLFEPVGDANVLSVNASGLVLDRALSVAQGDLVYLGDALQTVDGQASRALAGAAGVSYARVLKDAEGSLQVPHYRAIDVARDNRIAPTKVQHSWHRFAIPPSCSNTTAEVRVTLLYRPIPLSDARLRGWNATDYRIGESAATVAIP